MYFSTELLNPTNTCSIRCPLWRGDAAEVGRTRGVIAGGATKNANARFLLSAFLWKLISRSKKKKKRPFNDRK